MAKRKAGIPCIKGAKVTLKKGTVKGVPAGRYVIRNVRAKTFDLEPVKHLSTFHVYEVAR